MRAVAGVATVVLIVAGTSAVAWVLSTWSAVANDFSQDYFAAKVLLRGGSIYGQEVVELGREHFATPSPANFHPPTLTVLFLPLALLPYRLAYVLLGLLNVILYAGSIALAAKVTVPSYRSWWLPAALLWWPFWACLTHGQVSMAVAAALTASWFYDQHGRPVTSGALAGLAVLLKLFPALVVLYFLIRRDLRALISMLLVTAAGLAIGWLVVGSEDVVRYVWEVAPESASRWSSHPLNVSLYGAMSAVFGDPAWGTEPLVRAPSAARALTVVLGLAIFAATAVRGSRLRHTSLGARRLFAGICAAALLLSPLTWSHTLAVALLPLVVEVGRPQSARSRWLVLCVGLLLIGFPINLLARLVAPLFSGGWIPGYVAAVFQVPAVGLAVLWWRLLDGRE